MGNNINDNLPGNPLGFDWTTGQDIYDMAQGVGAELTGQPYNIYRLNNTSSTDVITMSNLIFSNYPCYRELFKANKSSGMETDPKFSALFYGLNFDAAPIQVGDIMVQEDPFYGPGKNQVLFPTNQFNGICFCSEPVLKTAIGARLDRIASIYRIGDLGGSTYLSQTYDNANPVQLLNGTYIEGVTGSAAAKIPIGYMAEKRMRGSMYPELGDVPPKTVTKMFIPPMPGFILQSDDFIVTLLLDSMGNPIGGERYRIINSFNQNTGVIGNFVIAEREVGTTSAMQG